MIPAAWALSPTSRARNPTSIIGQGLQLLINLDHRGAVGADPLVGDGAGILIQIPDALLREWAKRPAWSCREPGKYAVAMCFLPREAKARDIVVKQFEHFIKVEGQKLLGWRDVPTDPGRPGQDRARPDAADPPGDHRRGLRTSRIRMQFERKLLAIRKQTQNPLGRAGQEAQAAGHNQQLYMPSFSTRTVVYKGLLLAHDVGRFYRDLHESAHRLGGGAGASALLHQHLPAAGSWRIPIASSPIMAKSTPCAATSTG